MFPTVSLSEAHPPFPTASQSTVDHALLLATLPSLRTPHFLAPVITAAVHSTRRRLVIVLFSRLFNVPLPSSAPAHLDPGFPAAQAISHTGQWDTVQRLLTAVYVQATKAAQEGGKVLMDIDVLLKGLNEDLDPNLAAGIDMVFRVSGDACAVPLPSSISLLRNSYLAPGDSHPDSQAVSLAGTPTPSASPDPPNPSTYPTTALGGTFDHLHAGHKILLSMAAWITERKLIVGITDDALLQGKSNKHILEKLPERTEHVAAFLRFFKPQLVLDLPPLKDVYGPTGWNPDIQALVVSKETLDGAEQIAVHRRAQHLPPLDTYTIDVISATDACLAHEDVAWLRRAKLSSTFIRQWIVDRMKQEEEEEGEEGEGLQAS